MSTRAPLNPYRRGCKGNQPFSTQTLRKREWGRQWWWGERWLKCCKRQRDLPVSLSSQHPHSLANVCDCLQAVSIFKVEHGALALGVQEAWAVPHRCWGWSTAGAGDGAQVLEVNGAAVLPLLLCPDVPCSGIISWLCFTYRVTCNVSIVFPKYS